ncbi:hypothetical protein [Sutcliffiella deserti]|uniref:hypothetical protein n=1 Tax=Sutcliffiella deserti TaxID=2875501 RepID=UPI001CBCE72A|nr:hypothetical protein [Sutcliffiella deserti]
MIALYGATIGLTLLLFLSMGVFIYLVSTGLNKKDAVTIDPFPPESKDEEYNKID